MCPKKIENIPLPLAYDTPDLHAAAADALGRPLEEIGAVRMIRRSLDARRRSPQFLANLEIFSPGEDPAPLWNGPQYAAKQSTRNSPLIVGAGPAGLFAALRLLEHGIKPLVIDRGAPVDERGRHVADFRRNGALNEESNYCYGEGGAGTFSDGKLYTRKKHVLVRTVLEWLVAFGAPEFETLIESRPHVGTNYLIPILKKLREDLQAHGAEIRFHTRLLRFLYQNDGGHQKIVGAELSDGTHVDCENVILATGHSARPLYRQLLHEGVAMESKPTAIGFRLEHPQEMIDASQFGASAGKGHLGAASYRLACQADGRGVYSFCMCPGGFVIPTPVRDGHLNVNGMSNSNRGGPFANSAIVTTVDAEDYAKLAAPDVPPALAGLAFQDALEQACFTLGGGSYIAPAQRIPDFLRGRTGDVPEKTSFRPGIQAADLTTILPGQLHGPLREALQTFARKIRGFDSREAVAIGLETTTSAPLQILRDNQSLQSPTVGGLYPCGEGAGFAGGIVSSAIDGIRVADAIADQQA